MSLDYEKMLEEAYNQLPPEVFKHKRFEVPRPECTTFGSRTILHNFKEISDALNRNPQHVIRYLSKEMATAGTIDGARAIFQGRFDREVFNHLIERYIKEFVMCPICKRPDTRIVKEKRFSFMICEACGAKSPVRSI